MDETRGNFLLVVKNEIIHNCYFKYFSYRKKTFVIAYSTPETKIEALLSTFIEPDKILPITFASQKLSETWTQWSIVERAEYAAILCLKILKPGCFRQYVNTDNYTLNNERKRTEKCKITKVIAGTSI